MVDAVDVALGAIGGMALGYILSDDGKTDYSKLRKSLEGKDQIALIINLSKDDVGEKFNTVFSNMGYNKETGGICKIEKRTAFCNYVGNPSLKDIFLGRAKEIKETKTIYLDAVNYIILKKMDNGNTILNMRIYDRDGYRILDNMDLILIIDKFKENIIGIL